MDELELVPIEDVIGKNKKLIEIARYRNKERSKELENKNYAEYKEVIRSLKDNHYYDNPDCHLYHIKIKKYVQMVLDAEPIPNKSYIDSDWIMNWKGKKLKIKCISSYLNVVKEHLTWIYNIEHDEETDAFLLIAFDKESLDFKHIWFIMAKEIFETKKTKREFWDRNVFKLRDVKRVISRMHKYELGNELKKLKDIMENVRQESKNDIYNLHIIIIKKQNEIFDRIGEKRSIKEIVEQAIMAGIGKIEY